MQFTPASNVSEAASRFLFWAVNGLNKVLEMHFDFPFNLIGKLTIVLQQANRGVYSNLCKHLGPRTRFLHWLADKLDQRFTGNSSCSAGYEFV